MLDFNRFPNELAIAIFERLDACDLLAVSSTCRRWNELAKTPALVYIVLCYRYSVVDGPSDQRWPVHRRIEALASYYTRFSSLRWYKSYCFTKDAVDLWELFGGVYAQGSTKQSTLDFRKTMCATTAEQEAQWTVDTGLLIRDFGMDPFQDLLVLVRNQPTIMTHRELHLRTMSTGEEHPDAQEPVLRVSTPSRKRLDGCWIQVANEHIGILFSNVLRYNNTEIESNDLVVWNWRTGKIIFERSSTRKYLLASFCFLSQNHILATSRSIIHPAARDLNESAYLEVFDIMSPTTPVKRFLLPSLRPNVSVWSFDICCDPVPTPNAHQPRPFYTSPGNRLCVVTARFLYEVAGVFMEEHKPINFIFFTSSLLRDPPSLETETIDDVQNIRVIPWEQWADYTRVTIWKPAVRVFTICVSGTRFVRRIPGNAPNHYKIQICDFNKYALANQDTIANLGSAVCTTRYVHSSQENMLKNTILFNEPLCTSLPYLEITTRSSFKLHDVMIDHDNIYLVRDNGEMEVLAF